LSHGTQETRVFRLTLRVLDGGFRGVCGGSFRAGSVTPEIFQSCRIRTSRSRRPRSVGFKWWSVDSGGDHGLLAATIIPQFSDSTKDAQDEHGDVPLQRSSADRTIHVRSTTARCRPNLTELTLKTERRGATGTAATFVLRTVLESRSCERIVCRLNFAGFVWVLRAVRELRDDRSRPRCGHDHHHDQHFHQRNPSFLSTTSRRSYST